MGSLRKRLEASGPGVVIAVIALIFALAGTAFAAAKLNGTQKKEVKKIAKKYAGKRGKTGPAGANGAPGAQGPGGPRGPAGARVVPARRVRLVLPGPRVQRAPMARASKSSVKGRNSVKRAPPSKSRV